MANLSHLTEGLHTLLNMLGSVIRKAKRGKRTTLFREWRYRDNSWLAIGMILKVAGIAFLLWLLIVS